MRKLIAVDLRPLLEPFESGVAVYIREMLRVFLLSNDFDFLFFYQCKKKSEKIHNLFPEAIHIPKSNTLFHISSIFSFPQLPNVYFPRIPDLIWLPDRRPFYKTDIPIVLTIHDLVPEKCSNSLSLKSKIWHKIFNLKRLLKNSNGLLFPSLSVASQINNPNMKFEITYEGARLQSNPKKPCDWKKISKRSYFLTISPADPRKRLHWLYSMAKIFPKVNFVIAGIKNSETRFRKFLFKPLDNFILLPQIDEHEKISLIKNSVALISVSKYEGFDLPILEAVKAKRPVIISDIPVHRELYKSADFVVNKNDLILSIKRNLMGMGKLAIPRGNYTWELAAKRALLFFRRVIVDKNR